jgi:hypothetical protein
MTVSITFLRAALVFALPLLNTEPLDDASLSWFRIKEIPNLEVSEVQRDG